MAVQEWGGICIYRGILTLTPLPFPILFTDHNSWSRWVVFLLKRQRERERERESELSSFLLPSPEAETLLKFLYIIPIFPCLFYPLTTYKHSHKHILLYMHTYRYCKYILLCVLLNLTQMHQNRSIFSQFIFHSTECF